MLLGALLAAGFPEDVLHKTLQSLQLSDYELVIRKEVHHGLQATLVMVQSGVRQPHRHLLDIYAILDNSGLTETVVAKSKAVFLRLAYAEAAVHGCLPEDVHFHEVGAVDALIDVTGTVAGFEYLNIHKLVCSPLPLARGWVQCEHGLLPLPAPAVCHLLENVPVYGEAIEQELVTPTGAAIVTGLADDFGVMPVMRLQKTGYGAGTIQRQDGRPNLLRLISGKASFVDEVQQVVVLESNLDDWNPEFWPHVSRRFMTAGALDISLVPLHMKKGRPGFLLRIICDPAHMLRMEELIFSETSAIGLRLRYEQRITLPRKQIMVQTCYGDVQAKEIRMGNGDRVVTPEYESCCRIADKHNIPLQEVYREVILQAEHLKQE